MRMTLLLCLLTLGPYAGWRLASGLGWRRGARVLAAMAALLALVHYPLLAQRFGSLASLEIPRPLLVAGQVAATFVLLLAVLLLVRDAVAGIARLLSRRQAVPMRASSAALAGIALLAASLGVWQAIKVPAVNRIEVVLPGLDPAFDGYRLAHLTDIHISRLLQGDWLARVVARTNALQADAIVISGDLVDGPPSDRAGDFPPYARLVARDGVFAVTGNHEYYSGYAQWMPLFARLGLDLLTNEHRVLRRGDAALVIAGVPDRQSAAYQLPQPDVARAVAGAPAGAPVVLLDHRPDTIVDNHRHGIALQLSGHTHGGHIVGFDRLVARFNGGFVSGRYDVAGTVLWVGNGSGLWPGFAVRLGKPSQITEVTLRAPR